MKKVIYIIIFALITIGGVGGIYFYKIFYESNTLFNDEYVFIKIPTNSTENTRVSNWIIAKVSDFQEEQIKSFLNNPLNFYSKVPSNNLKELKLSDYNDITIALYQLYREIDYKTTFIATCEIESNNDF